MRYHKIPDETVRRLPTYLRELQLLKEQGTKNISSRELAESLPINPPLIRKDLSYFGDFGTPGVGYNTENLFYTGQCPLLMGEKVSYDIN